MKVKEAEADASDDPHISLPVEHRLRLFFITRHLFSLDILRLSMLPFVLRLDAEPAA